MEWARAKDWAVGAAGMLLVLVVGVAVLWWVVTEPSAGGNEGSASSHKRAPEPPPDMQAPAGLAEDEVWLTDAALRAGTVVTAAAMLRDVRAIGHEVVTGPEGLVAGRATVEATVPFQVVAEELGDGTVVRAVDGGQAMVVRTVDAFGRELGVTATGTVEVKAGRLVVEPRSIDFGGPDLLSKAVAAVARELVTIEHDIEGLPEGLVLRDVAVRADGFRAYLRGENVQLLP